MTVAADRTERMTERVGAPLLVGAAEVAHLLGVKSASTVRKWRDMGRLPAPLANAPGRALLWKRSEIEAWVEAGCPEIRSDAAGEGE